MSTKYFFESLDKSTSKGSLWNAPTMPLAGKVIKSGSLLKHSSNATSESGLIERYFILQDQHLMYKKSETSQSISSVMNIKYAKLLLPGNDNDESMSEDLIKNQKYWLKVCFKSKFSLLFAKSESEYHDWIAAFTSVMVRNDIHLRFFVEKPIGAGAFAQVFKAQEKSTGKWFAVKGFNKESVLQNSPGINALWNEIQMLRQVKGKSNMLNLYEVHETTNSVYLLTEYLEGGDLSQFIKKNKRISEEDIISIMCGILNGLKSENFVHRDLKPANIVLRKTSHITSDDVVIVDFGLAVNKDELNPIFKRCGTPGFIAPEVIGCKDSDKSFKIPLKCDVYSAGVIMHMLCTGKNLFDKSENDTNVTFKKNLQSNIDFPSRVFSRLGPQTNILLRTMLNADPEKRIAMDIAAALMMTLQPVKFKLSGFFCRDIDQKSPTDTLPHIFGAKILAKTKTFTQNPAKNRQSRKSAHELKAEISEDQIKSYSPVLSKYIKDRPAIGYEKVEASPLANSSSPVNQPSKWNPYNLNSFGKQSTQASPNFFTKPLKRRPMVVKMKDSSYFEPSATIFQQDL